jgi:hypothetical protein
MTEAQRANLPGLRTRIAAAARLELPQDAWLALTQADAAIGALVDENHRLAAALRRAKRPTRRKR